jgi:hypothetical protein
MQPARTLDDAAYNSLLNFNRNIWEEPSDWWSFEDAYVDRSLAPDGDLAPRFKHIGALLLNNRGNTKVLFTGQIGSGKSMELRKLAEEPAIRQIFEIVRFSVLDKLNDAIDNDINHVLLATASELVDHVVKMGYHQIGRWDKADRVSKDIRGWLTLLLRGPKPELPDKFDQMTVKLKTELAEWSVRLRSESERRDEVSKLEVRQLQLLVSMFLMWIEDVSERKVLLIVDDGDKLHTEVSLQSIFVRGVRTLTELPCKMILTYPFQLAFREDFVAPPEVLREQLFNIKVIKRSEPARLLDGARTFFRSLLDRLVDPAAGLIDPAVVDEAARLSAGVPREFVRLLQKGAETAATDGSPRVDHRIFTAAIANFRRSDMISRTRLGDTPTALMRVRLTKAVRHAVDLRLLRGNLLVEYVNETPWYDVNPILVAYVDDLLESEREQLVIQGSKPPELEARLLARLEPKGG